MRTIQNYINHIAFAIDASGSMRGRDNEVIKAFDNQIRYLAKRSVELNQETRVSVYLFNTTVECLVFDMDVMRLPSLAGLYSPSGGTALIDTAIKVIDDMYKIPELYGDHATLFYLLTDGEERDSRHSPAKLSAYIAGLPANWTIAVLVPDQRGVFEAKQFGFPAENISIWDATSVRGMQEMDRTVTQATERFYTARAAGVRGTKSLFKVDVAKVSSSKVANNLNELHPRNYDLLTVPSWVDGDRPEIRGFVEVNLGRPYRLGSGFYEFTKPEKIQPSKDILIKNRISGKIYSGPQARKIIGLPDYEIRVQPENLDSTYKLFVQSTSVNRKLVEGTELVVLK
jgi:hypothetical protein